MKMSRIHLAKFYKSRNISYRKANLKMWGDKDDFTRSCDKLKFILKMANILKTGAELIWLDETTVNQWGTRVDKIWQEKDNPIVIRLPDRGSSVTVYGALFSKDGRLVYFPGTSTCTDELIPFLEVFVTPEINREGKTYLVMDNHGAHKSLLTTAYLEEIGLEVLWIPAYASELNPVEWIWKLFKDAWHKDMFRRYLAPDAP